MAPTRALPLTMLCQTCNQNPATVHVTEIVHSQAGGVQAGGVQAGGIQAGGAAASGATDGTTASGAPAGGAHKSGSQTAASQGASAPPGNAAGSTSTNAGSAPNPPHAALKIQEQHLCEACAQTAKLPHLPVKGVAEIWKLLQASAQRSKREVGIVCPECGMSLMEFRQKGRLGCPKDYEVFGAQLRDLLERIHGANRHVGRLPGLDEASMLRLERVNELQSALESAIRDEAYEAAAKLRDELKSLQQP